MVEMEQHFIKSIEKQMRKLASESIINKWWECFLYGIKSPENVRLIYKEDFKLEGLAISFHFKQVFAKMSQLWFVLYKEAIPGSTFIKDQIKNSEGFVKYHNKGLKMDSGREVKTSSGYEMNLSKTGFYDEIFDATSYQHSKLLAKNPQTDVFSTTTDEDDKLIYTPPVTPEQNKSRKQEDPENGDFFNKIITDDEN